MGRVVSQHVRENLVSKIESIIHHPSELATLVKDAKVMVTKTGQLPDTTIWNYLTWRRDLNPLRFDHYHPEFVSIFKHEQHLLNNDPPSSLQTVTPVTLPIQAIPVLTIPSTSVTSSSPSGPVGGAPDARPSPHVVPEPASVIMMAGALIAAGVGLMTRRYRVGGALKRLTVN